MGRVEGSGERVFVAQVRDGWIRGLGLVCNRVFVRHLQIESGAKPADGSELARFGSVLTLHQLES